MLAGPYVSIYDFSSITPKVIDKLFLKRIIGDERRYL